MAQTDQLEPTDELLDLIFLALDHGIDSVRDRGRPLIPFLMTRGARRPRLQRFVADSLDVGRKLAQEAASRLPFETCCYAIACDGYLPTEEERFDAIVVEAAERGQPVGFVLAQRYRPARGKRKFEVLGNPVLVKQVPHRFDN